MTCFVIRANSFWRQPYIARAWSVVVLSGLIFISSACSQKMDGGTFHGHRMMRWQVGVVFGGQAFCWRNRLITGPLPRRIGCRGTRPECCTATANDQLTYRQGWMAPISGDFLGADGATMRRLQPASIFLDDLGVLFFEAYSTSPSPVREWPMGSRVLRYRVFQV